MSPNLVAGMAPGSTQSPGEPDVDPMTAKAILQSWSEVKSEDGSVARTFAQCAQTWPLADTAAFENIEAAIQVLRQACDYLHQGLTQVGAAVEQKIDTGKVQAAINEIARQIQSMKASMTDSANRQTVLATRIDGTMEKISTGHGRLEAANAQLEREGAAQGSDIGELRESTRRCQSDIAKMTECLELAQIDSQRIDQKIFDLQENLFNNGVELERGLENSQARITQLQHPAGVQISVEVNQDHARGTEQ